MNKIALIQMIMENIGIEIDRLALEWVSAAEAPRFVQVITEFTDRIYHLGHMGEREGLDREALIHKIKAAKMAVEGMKIRMAFAKQAKKIKEEGTYGQLPAREKLVTMFMNEMARHEKRLKMFTTKNTKGHEEF
jgi:hypothetical protein